MTKTHLKFLRLVCLGVFIFYAFSVQASPQNLTYQGRIVKSDGTPLEYYNVSFLFEITNPLGSCVIYREQIDGINMTNSKGVFDVPIGLGTRLFPTGPVYKISDAFVNSMTHACYGGATFTALEDDNRVLKVQFHDGSGWKQISPSNVIRAVPYALSALSASKLGTLGASDFVQKTNVPGAACDPGKVITFDGTKFSCVVDAGGSGVINDILAGTGISVSGTTTKTVSANIGTVAGTVAAGDDSRFTNSRVPTGTAGGDLGGTYPNPSVAKIQGVAVSATAPTNGHFLKFDGTQWGSSPIGISDVTNLNSTLTNYLTTSAFNTAVGSASCSAHQAAVWSSLTDMFTCQNIGSLDAAAITTGTIASARLPAGASMWQDGGSGKIYYSAGNVGMGTTAPTFALDVQRTDITPIVNIQNNDTSAASRFPGVNMVNYTGSTTNGLPVLSLVNSKGNSTTSSSLTSNMRLGMIAFRGGNSATPGSYNQGATITAYAAENFSTGAGGTHLTFDTMNSGGVVSSEKMRITSNGNIGIGTTSPTAALHLKAGTATASTAPLKFTAGTNLSTPENGAVEFDGTDLFFTSGGTRRTIASASAGTTTNISNITNSSGSVTVTPSVGNSLIVNSSTVSTNSSSGALIVNGGAGIGGALNVGGALNATGSASIGSRLYMTQDASPSAWIAATGSGTDTQRTAMGFTADTTTGLIDHLKFRTNGAERMRVDVNGNVGIGSTNPSSKLHIASESASVADTIMTRATADGNAMALFSQKARGTLSSPTIVSSGDTVMAMIGQGYDGAAYQEAARIQFSTDAAPAAGSMPGRIILRTTASGSTSSTERMRIDSTGNIGIGTTSPGSKLDVVAGAGVPMATISNVETNSTAKQGIFGTKHYLSAEEPVIGLQAYANATDNQVYLGGGTNYGNAATHLLFYTASDNTTLNGSERMRIMPSGNVGIGTTNPVQTLSVVGSQSLSAYGGGAWFGMTRINGSSASPTAVTNGDFLASIALRGYDGTTNVSTASINASVTGAVSSGVIPSDLYFSTTGNVAGQVERMRITSSGNVGIGTTTPRSKVTVVGTYLNPTGTPDDGLMVASGTVQTSGLNVYGPSVSFGQADGNSSTRRRAAISTVQTDATTPARNGLAFFTYGAGGTQVTDDVNEKMRIDHNGNVGIGTTAPASKLEVAGTVAASSFSVGPQIVNATCSNAAGSSCTATATCPGGKNLLSGGFTTSWAAATVLQSYPSATNAWTCLFYSASALGPHTCYALCANVQ